MKLGNVTIGGGACRTVAEVGQLPRDSLSMHHLYVRKAKEVGAHFCKFQILSPDTIAAPDSPPYWATDHHSQHEAFEKFGYLDRGKWGAVKEECDRVGIGFAATPFDLEAVEVLEEVGPAFIKIASGDITYKELVRRAAAVGVPLVISTGAATRAEIQQAVNWVRGRVPVILLACTLRYPTPVSQAFLKRIELLRQHFPYYHVGLSDHTETELTGFAAAAMGAVLLEKHFTLSRNEGADDERMALLPGKMGDYVKLAELGALMRGGQGLKPSTEELPAREGARRSLWVVNDVKKGEKWGRHDLMALRPAGGVGPERVGEVVGQVARRDYKEGEVLDADDFPIAP